MFSFTAHLLFMILLWHKKFHMKCNIYKRQVIYIRGLSYRRVFRMYSTILTLIASIACLQTVLGHGHMYHPSPWPAKNDCSPDESPLECKYLSQVPHLWNDDRCIKNENAPKCSFSAGRTAWYVL